MQATYPHRPSLASRVLVAAIALYQRHLSPHKGFACAHRVLHQDLSCSHAVKAIVLEQPAGAWPRLITRRFQACAAAARVLRMERKRAAEQLPAGARPASGEGSGLLEALCCLGETASCLLT